MGYLLKSQLRNLIVTDSKKYFSALNLTSDISTQTGSFDKKEAATTNGVVIPIIPLIKAEKNVRNSGGDQVGKIGNNLPASSPEVQLLVEPNPSQNNSALKSVPASKVGPKISSEDVAQVPSTSDTRVVPSTSTSATAVPIANEWKKVRLPWYAGSEYRCNICSVLFFYNQVKLQVIPSPLFYSFTLYSIILNCLYFFKFHDWKMEMSLYFSNIKLNVPTNFHCAISDCFKYILLTYIDHWKHR